MDKKSEVEQALTWVDSIRTTEFGHSENEKKLILLADEVKRLQRELKMKRLSARK